jgi:hypothetical protein
MRQPRVIGLKKRPCALMEENPRGAIWRLSSAGVTNFRQSCVPRGSSPSMYSPPTIPKKNDLSVRLRVAIASRIPD